MILNLSNLTVGYNGVAVIQNLSLSLEEGRSLLLIGHNGAGKSTLLKSMLGLIPVMHGAGMLAGVDLRQASPRRLMEHGVRYLGQDLRAFNSLKIMSSRKVLNRLYGFKLESIDIPGLSKNTHGNIGDLSIGQRRMEAICLLSVGKPKVFILDEPTAGLDARHEHLVADWVSQAQSRGLSFIVVEHKFRLLLDLFDDAAVLRRGQLTYWGNTKALKDEKALASVFL